MIISEKYKLIFLHIPKSGGTYVTQALVNLDPDVKRYTFNNSGHIRGVDCIGIIGLEKYREYTVFCVIRNTYDKLYSLYGYILVESKHYLHEHLTGKSFGEFVEYITSNDLSQTILNTYYILDDRENLIVDYMIPFENLTSELGKFLKKFTDRNVLPTDVINKTQYKNRKEFPRQISNNISKINEVIRRDIEYFNMTFDIELS